MDSLATLGSWGCEEASLEYAPGLLQTERGRSLHGFTAVAPLKCARTGTTLGDGEASPRLHRRGPIEVVSPCLMDSHAKLVSTASPPWPH